MKLYYTIIFLVLLSSSLFAQRPELSITGTLHDAKSGQPLPSANVILTSKRDSTKRLLTVTNAEGKFAFNKLKPSIYQVEAKYIGYTTKTEMVKLFRGSVDLGVWALTEDKKMLSEVQVREMATTAEIKGDTVAYNANAFKTNPDANAEDLIEKMPGITVNNGKVTAMGEDVKKVLVDGKTFFSNDPNIALKNLPAEIISKIEVFDKMSDQAELTGFDDGNSVKTINIITKANMKTGQFGKVYAGYGTDDRFTGGGNINIFNGDQRISVIGLTNNVNQQNFSTQDLMGVVGSSSRRRRRGGRGMMGRGNSIDNFLVDNQQGITTTHSLGVNFNDQWGEKLEVNGSYFFNYSGNENDENLFRTYFPTESQTLNQFYDENSISDSRNINHRANFKIDYKINKYNSFIIRPSINFQQFKSSDDITGENTLGEENSLLSQSENVNALESFGYNISNNLLYRRTFDKRGRTISLNLRTSANDKTLDNLLNAENSFYNTVRGDYTNTIEQTSEQETNGYALSSRLVYTEPLGKTSMLMFNYQAAYNNNGSFKETYDISEEGGEELNEMLSNQFDNNYLTQEGGVGYMFRKGFNLFLMSGVNYQHAELVSEQLFPTNNLGTPTYTFSNLLPFVRLKYRVSREKQFGFMYRGGTNSPSISQLQNVINNNNPLQLSSGNPDLQQQYTHTLKVDYKTSNLEKGQTLFTLFSLQQANNYITNSMLIADERVELEDGTVLNQGASYTKPVNLDGYWNVRGMLNYGFPFKLIRSNLNLTAGVNYSQTPGLINNSINIVDNYGVNHGLVIASNISEKVDFTITSSGSYNTSDNTLQPDLNATYYTQTTGAKLNLIFGKGFVFNTKLSHIYYTGLSDDFNQEFFLWNISIGKKFLKDDKGELKLSVFDLLEQNTSLSRVVNTSYIEDVRNLTLTQYVMLTFSYKLRNFGKAPEKNGKRDGFRPPFGGGGRF